MHLRDIHNYLFNRCNKLFIIYFERLHKMIAFANISDYIQLDKYS